MDPVSLTATIITILGAGGTIAKGLGKIRGLQHAPNVLLQLNNEVTDIHLLIESVDDVARQWTYQPSTSDRQRNLVCATLSRAKFTVLELEKLIAYVLTKETNTGTEVDRSAWVRNLDEIKDAKDNIRRAREDLNTVWATLSHSRASGRIELELRDLVTAVSHLRSDHEASGEVLRGACQQSVVQRDMFLELEKIMRRESPQEITDPTTELHSEPVTQTLSNCGNEEGSASFICRLTKRGQCSMHCVCVCHRRTSFWSPRVLNHTLGSLFIGYSGSAQIFQQCNMTACRAQPTKKWHVYYMFPRWMLNRAILVQVCLQGPELLLRCLRIRCYATTLAFQSVAHGRLDLIQNLMAVGQASVLDVDEGGASLLHAAVKIFVRLSRAHSQLVHSWLALIEYLLQENADPFLMDGGSSNAYAELCELYLLEPSHIEQHSTLGSLIRMGDPVHALGLTKLHISVLRLDAMNIREDIISLTPRESIDELDAMRRTALSWAARRGDIDQIRRLLIKGADPNMCDNKGKGPLMYCANNSHCLTLLLEAGADPNHVNWRGYSKLCSLISGTDDISYAEVLLRYGANLNLQRNDISAIVESVQRYRPHTLKWLLDHDVELERRAPFGNSVLLEFISTSEDAGSNMLEMLLEKKPQCSTVNDSQEGLLHYIARFSGCKHMSIFQRMADLSDLDPDQRSISGVKLWEERDPGMTALELAKWRRDHQAEWVHECNTSLDPDPAAWFAAFIAFIESIKAAHEAKLRTSDNRSVEALTSITGDEADAGVSTSVDHGMCPRVPGAYPPE